MGAGKVIASWCLGIAHHRNAVETIREIINLLLLRGNIGRPGAGVSPVRGHSNIQGIRTAGAGEDMPVALLEAIEKNYGIRVPREPGLSAIPAIRAAAAGKVKVLLSLGGNLASSLPDTPFTETALRRCSLTVMISTKLNRSHLVTGKRALILPCLSRTEEDVQNGIIQSVTVEDSMGHIGISTGCLQPVSPDIRSEVAIVAGIAAAVCRGPGGPDWQRAAGDYGYVRTEIARTIPALKGIADLPKSGQGIRLDNPLRKRIFPTATGKALFSCDPLVREIAADGELMMMTIRSHDQFNTSVFGLNDRYRGINQERRVLFMNETDMARLGIAAEGTVAICGGEGEEARRLEGYYAIAYPITEGCCAAYFPEANVLVPVDHAGKICPTPAYKSIHVRVEAG
jgi:molybdopterin-dependent oxidoreductase alpha subunit